MKKILLFFVILIFTIPCCLSAQDAELFFPILKGKYLGQKTPGIKPEVFAPGIVSSKKYFEFSNTFTPDGNEFYFSRRMDKKDVLMVTRWTKNGWTKPEPADFYVKYKGFEPHVSKDGNLYITRFAPPPHGIKESKDRREMEAQMVNIWKLKRNNKKWAEPEFCVNGMYVTTANNGNIYTTDIHAGTEGICRYVYNGNGYEKKQILGGGVNSPSPGAHPCISPDESFIVFDSERKEDPVDADLYVCFKKHNGSWSSAVNLGKTVNTSGSEIAAALSPDGKYLFYQSKGDIYWVSVKLIEDLKAENFN